MYAIRIDKTGRYIEWCNCHWYGTKKEPLYIFDRGECTVIAKYLKDYNYVYNITLVDEDGKEENLNALGNRKVIISRNGLPILISRGNEEEPVEKKKKSLFSLNFNKLELAKLKI